MSLIICGQDNTIISTAPIYISGEFHFLQDVGWYSSVYTLVVCTTQLLFSKLIARYSICWIYTIAIFLLLTGFAVCGMHLTPPALTVGRATAALGRAGLLITAFSLGLLFAPPAKRPIALGFISATRGLAMILCSAF